MLAHPHEYALLYGSPVPGYQAPQDTVPAAVRDTVVYGRIVSDAHRAGTLNPQGDHPPVPPSFREDAARLRELMPDVPDDMIVRGLIAWTGLFGRLSFELFGQFDNATLDRATAFDHTMRCHARTLGLPV